LGSEVQNLLIVFDVEGVIIPQIRFLLFEVVGRMGIWPFIKAAFFGLLYQIGFVSLKKSLKEIYGLLRGLPYERLLLVFQRVPLMPSVEQVFKDLKEDGFKTILISSGIPRIVLEKLAERLGADYVSGLEIGLSEGRLTGEIWGDVLEPEGKSVALKKILSDEGLSPCYCIGVADDRNNLSMFQLCNLKIGYNPDFVLSYKSDYALKGDLSDIIPIIKGGHVEKGSQGLCMSSVPREIIHISGFFVALVGVTFVNRYTIAFLIFLAAMLYTASETERMFGIYLPLVSKITLIAARRSEIQEFVASPIFYALGLIMSLTLFPESIGYVAIAVLTLGDGFASVFGIKFGQRRVPFNKSKKFEGTIGGFFFAFLGSLLFVDPLRAFLASAVGMIVEILPLPLNDNVTISLASGLTLMALM